MDARLQKALDDAYKFKHRNAKPIGNLEDKMTCVAVTTNFGFEDIKKMTIRRFNKVLERADYVLHYRISKSAEYMGTKFKKDIDGWMSDLTITDEDIIRDLTVDFGEFSNKMGNKK